MKTLRNIKLAMGNGQSAIGKGRWMYFLSPIVYCLLFISCGNNEADSNKNQDLTNNDKIQKVEVVKPEQRAFKAEVLITGTTRPNKIVSLYAMESGMLVQMRKDIGDRVKQGEIIAILKNPVLQQQQIKWQVEEKVKKTNYQRLNSLYDKTPALTNIQMVENAEAEYLSAKANLVAFNNRIGFLSIKAPFSGIIAKRFVDNGAMIQSGLNDDNAQAIVELQQVNPIRLTIPVPESDAVGIHKGMEVEVTLPELSGKSFTATVSRTSNALDPMSKTMRVEIDLENPDGKILSGMYAKALLQINSRENILSVPTIAKVSHKNENYVLAVEDGKVKRLPVKIGFSNRDYFEVLNDEFTANTQVIVQGKSLVKPDQIVEPILK